MLDQNFIVDNLLLLYLLKEQEEFSQKKLTKLIFLSELEMEKKNLFGFDFHFVRYRYGPYSFSVPGVKDFLVVNELIDTFILDIGPFQSHNSSINKHGQVLLDEFEELFSLNRKVVDQLDLVLDEFGNFSGKRLENICYQIEINGIKIRNILPNQTILNPKRNLEKKERFEIDNDWVNTFLLLMDKRNYRQIKRAIKLNRQTIATKYPY
ncbi:MAG: hypothetical protein HWN66_11325 [Candidatus Helarchaeota archaeon]|nr:hypothetical protein [Candidatus Helarchaeota archaeon]